MTKLAYILILVPILFISCETADPWCSRPVEIDSFDNERVSHHIDTACKYFASRTQHHDYIVATALDEVEVIIREHREPTQCSVPTGSCALLAPRPARLDIIRDNWQAHLHHEVWHLLLFRLEPGLSTDDHHARMLEAGLCQPPRLCGYGTNPG